MLKGLKKNRINEKYYLLKTATPKEQNLINESIVINYISKNNNISRSEISKNLGISAPTVSKIVDKLIKDHYVLELEKGVSTGGKKPTNLIFNKKLYHILNVDLDKKKLILGLSDMDNQIIAKQEGFKIVQKDEKILTSIVSAIKDFILKYGNMGVNNISIDALSIGVPGNVNIEKGEIISAPLFKNWLNLNLKEYMQKIFNLPVFIENIVNLSAIAEHQFGVGKNYTDLAFIEISNGIGAGLILNNNLYRGAINSAGEIGFSIFTHRDLDFEYKIKGRFEKEMGIDNIEKKVISELESGVDTKIKNIIQGDLNSFELSQLFLAALDEDDYSVNMIKQLVDKLAILLTNIILLINPEIVVIGGQIIDMPYLEELLISPIKNKVYRILPFKPPEIKISKLGHDAGILGASYFATENILTNKYPYLLNIKNKI